jgi:hypothetical protein
MTFRALDLVLTITVALTVGVLGALDVVGPAVTGGATLTTLGLLAVSSLHGRSDLGALTRSVTELGRGLSDRTSADRLLEPSTSGVDLDLGAADDIRVLGVTLARTIRNHYAALEQRLAAGATVRIALIAPRAETVAEAARRSTIAGNPAIFEHRLRPTLDLLDDLTESAAAGPGRIEVRLLDFVPAFGLVAVDADTPHGQVRVDIYSHHSGTTEPTLPLYADHDVRWFRHFVAEFDRVWAAGRPYSATAGGGESLQRAGGDRAGVAGAQPAADGRDGVAGLEPRHLGAGGRGQFQVARDARVDHDDRAHPVTPGLQAAQAADGAEQGPDRLPDVDPAAVDGAGRARRVRTGWPGDGFHEHDAGAGAERVRQRRVPGQAYALVEADARPPQHAGQQLTGAAGDLVRRGPDRPQRAPLRIHDPGHTAVAMVDHAQSPQHRPSARDNVAHIQPQPTTEVLPNHYSMVGVASGGSAMASTVGRRGSTRCEGRDPLRDLRSPG